jgi:hypothetical protein
MILWCFCNIEFGRSEYQDPVGPAAYDFFPRFDRQKAAFAGGSLWQHQGMNEWQPVK